MKKFKNYPDTLGRWPNRLSPAGAQPCSNPSTTESTSDPTAPRSIVVSEKVRAKRCGGERDGGPGSSIADQELGESEWWKR